jgi:hypothetical protein
MRLRFTLAPHVASGYEITLSVTGGANGCYALIARWNGHVADFDRLLQLDCRTPNEFSVTTGDVIRATIVESLITVYKNGHYVMSVNDGTFTTGNPGLGVDAGHGNGTYGFSSFRAGD